MASLYWECEFDCFLSPGRIGLCFLSISFPGFLLLSWLIRFWSMGGRALFPIRNLFMNGGFLRGSGTRYA
ncbi:MAG: hypothetical protein EGQ81_01620 [Akkermansia sp.]|nr:hypothetical protein [Akkermansia sp.]